jgi:hypothetical protein
VTSKPTRAQRSQRARIALPTLAVLSLAPFAASCSSSSSSSSASSGITYASVQQVSQKLGAHGTVCPLGLDPTSAGKTAGIAGAIIPSQFLMPNALGSASPSPSGSGQSGPAASLECNYLVVGGTGSSAVDVVLEAVDSGSAIGRLGLAPAPGDQSGPRQLSAFVASFTSSPPSVGKAVSVPGVDGIGGGEEVELVRLKTSGAGDVLLDVNSPSTGEVVPLPDAQLQKLATALAAQIKLS